MPGVPYATQAGEITIDASHHDAGTAYAAINLQRRGDYAPYAEKAHRMLVEFDKPGRASRPEAVARKIRKAATKKRPAARYPVGRGAGMITTSRDHTPDVIYDQVISRMYGSR